MKSTMRVWLCENGQRKMVLGTVQADSLYEADKAIRFKLKGLFKRLTMAERWSTDADIITPEPRRAPPPIRHEVTRNLIDLDRPTLS